MLRLAALVRVRASSEAPAVACVGLPPPSVHRGGARMAHHPGQPSVAGPDQHLSAGRGRPPRRTAAQQHHHRHRQYYNYLVSFFALVCWRRSWGLREHLLDSLSGSVLISECCSPIDYSISFWSISFLKRTDVKWSVLIYDKVVKGYILLWICHSIICNALL